MTCSCCLVKIYIAVVLQITSDLPSKQWPCRQVSIAGLLADGCTWPDCFQCISQCIQQCAVLLAPTVEMRDSIAARAAGVITDVIAGHTSCSRLSNGCKTDPKQSSTMRPFHTVTLEE